MAAPSLPAIGPVWADFNLRHAQAARCLHQVSTKHRLLKLVKHATQILFFQAIFPQGFQYGPTLST